MTSLSVDADPVKQLSLAAVLPFKDNLQMKVVHVTLRVSAEF